MPRYRQNAAKHIAVKLGRGLRQSHTIVNRLSSAVNRYDLLMARPSANLRLFAALYPPQETVERMMDALTNEHLPPHRLTPPDQVHMTVQFIGDVPAVELDDTIESVRRAVAGLRTFSLQPTRLITLPERGPARLIALECESHPTLMEIHRRLVVRLASRVSKRDAERFRPHITLCRFRTPARGFTLDRTVVMEPFAVHRIVLMRSTLSPHGAMHYEVAYCELE